MKHPPAYSALNDNVRDRHERVFTAAHIRRTQVAAAGKRFADDMAGVDGVHGRVGWYVVGVRGSREQAVFEAMGDSQLDVLLPTRKKRIVGNPRRRGGKVRVVDVPMFGGYLFVRLWPSAEAWQGIYGFEHVQCVLGSERGPLPVLDRHINKLKGFDAVRPVLREEQYLVGDAVRICDGPLDGLAGEVVRDSDNRGYIKLLVSMFGNAIPMRLPLAIVEKIN